METLKALETFCQHNDEFYTRMKTILKSHEKLNDVFAKLCESLQEARKCLGIHENCGVCYSRPKTTALECGRPTEFARWAVPVLPEANHQPAKNIPLKTPFSTFRCYCSGPKSKYRVFQPRNVQRFATGRCRVAASFLSTNHFSCRTRRAGSRSTNLPWHWRCRQLC